ncbi:hypothetical protein CEP51_016522, partial [Fusarium floridanum]
MTLVSMVSVGISDSQSIGWEIVNTPVAPFDEPEPLCQPLNDGTDMIAASYIAVLASKSPSHQLDIKSLLEIHANHGMLGLACHLRDQTKLPCDTTGPGTWPGLREDCSFFCRRAGLKKVSSDKDTGSQTTRECILHLSDVYGWWFDKGKKLDRFEIAFHLGQFSGSKGYLPPPGNPQKGLNLLISLSRQL